MKISVVIPCYNEEQNIPILVKKLTEVLNKYSDYEIIFVDDGSTDATLERIKELVENGAKIKYLAFSRNFGQQKALKAGLDYSTGDCLITLDADLQHPPELVDAMIQKWQEGYDIVYTVRKEYPDASFLKRKTSWLFYKLLNKISEIEITPGTADFRLLDRKVIDILRELNETFIFLRGLVSWVGFRQYALEYTPQKRYSGKTKYSFKNMILLAITGITSFSTRPLHLATFLGLILAFLCILYGGYAVGITIFTDKTVPGWASLIVSVLFIGSIQLLILGIIGEYLGKLFIESKRRPQYIIKEKNCEK
ncbi:MAG: glycosyltransferase family 2 protein [bacterium]|nr:glycosyltransferase family 2 protein [bacterium]